MQIIYAGKTPSCLPTYKFPPDFHVIFGGCEIVIVPHNLLKNKFQPLDLTVNQSAKAFIKPYLLNFVTSYNDLQRATMSYNALQPTTSYNELQRVKNRGYSTCYAYTTVHVVAVVSQRINE